MDLGISEGPIGHIRNLRMRLRRSDIGSRLFRLLAILVAVLWLCVALHGVFHHHDSNDAWGQSCLLCLLLGSISACGAGQAAIVFFIGVIAPLQAFFSIPSVRLWRRERLRGPPLFG